MPKACATNIAPIWPSCSQRPLRGSKPANHTTDRHKDVGWEHTAGRQVPSILQQVPVAPEVVPQEDSIVQTGSGLPRSPGPQLWELVPCQVPLSTSSCRSMQSLTVCHSASLFAIQSLTHVCLAGSLPQQSHQSSTS